MVTIKSLVITCCVAAGTIALPALASGKSHGPENIASTLKDLRYTASSAADDAAVLESLSRAVDSWRSHANRLEDLKVDVNEMGRLLGKLENERDAATPIERDAIDRAHVLLRDMAGNITAAIRYVNESPLTLWKGSYQKLVATLAEESANLDSTLNQFSQLAHARAKEKSLEKTLSVEAGE